MLKLKQEDFITDETILNGCFVDEWWSYDKVQGMERPFGEAGGVPTLPSRSWSAKSLAPRDNSNANKQSKVHSL